MQITSSGGLTNHTDQTISGTVTDAVGVGKTVFLYDNDSPTALGTATVGTGGNWTATVVLSGDGPHSIVAKDTDGSGNTGASSALSFVLDATKPVPVMQNAIFDPTTDLKTLYGTSEANSSVSIYDSGKLIGTITAAADGTWSLQANVSGSAVHSYTETATDLAGNVGSSAGVTLYTPAAHNSLQGGSGNDVLIGRPNDTLEGGSGSDTFVFNPGSGKETISDFVAAGSTHDIIELHQLGLTNFEQVNAAQVGKDVVITVDPHDTIKLVGVHLGDLTASDFHFT